MSINDSVSAASIGSFSGRFDTDELCHMFAPNMWLCLFITHISSLWQHIEQLYTHSAMHSEINKRKRQLIKCLYLTAHTFYRLNTYKNAFI